MKPRLILSLSLSGAGFLAFDGAAIACLVWIAYPFTESQFTAVGWGALIGAAAGLLGGALVGACVRPTEPPGA